MWNDLSRQWQMAFSLAWESFKSNTVPIGAVIVDEKNNTIAVGRNMIFDKTSSNSLAGTYMAHAEMTAMMQLKEADHPNIKSYTLYTTMEPCPMCFGTMLMVHICNLRFAARDGFAGAIELKDKSEYLKNKKMIIEQGTKEMELFQIVLQSAFEYKRLHRRIEDILSKWREYCSHGIELGRELFEDGYFETVIKNKTDISVIYDEVVKKYNSINDLVIEKNII